MLCGRRPRRPRRPRAPRARPLPRPGGHHHGRWLPGPLRGAARAVRSRRRDSDCAQDDGLQILSAVRLPEARSSARPANVRGVAVHTDASYRSPRAARGGARLRSSGRPPRRLEISSSRMPASTNSRACRAAAGLPPRPGLGSRPQVAGAAGLITALDTETRGPPQRMSTDGTWLLGELTAIITALDARAADHTSAEWPDHELPRRSQGHVRLTLPSEPRQPNPRNSRA